MSEDAPSVCSSWLREFHDGRHNHLTELRSEVYDNITSIDYISQPLSYQQFFERYLLPNKPCVLGPFVTADWRSRKEWPTSEGKPDLQYLSRVFGSATVPVADCQQEMFSSHPKKDMSMTEYATYWQDLIDRAHPSDDPYLYLKDWHFTRAFPRYEAYRVPVYFRSDWLNEFWDQRSDSSDDYRFVYMGPKGTWTPFHADVFRSYSWSANICGRKRWILIPPGEEEKLKDKFGQLLFDLTDNDPRSAAIAEKYKSCRHFVIDQKAGEIIYVPSGWHHQVFNLEDTISINHNWINGCAVDLSWRYIQSCLGDVQREIADCQDMEGWHQQCQLILKASSGIDYEEFFRFLHSIAVGRIKEIYNDLSCGIREETEDNGTIAKEYMGTGDIKDCSTVTLMIELILKMCTCKISKMHLHRELNKTGICQSRQTHGEPERHTHQSDAGLGEHGKLASQSDLKDTAVSQSDSSVTSRDFKQPPTDRTSSEHSHEISKTSPDVKNTLCDADTKADSETVICDCCQSLLKESASESAFWHWMLDLMQIHKTSVTMMEDSGFKLIYNSSFVEDPAKFNLILANLIDYVMAVVASHR